MLWLKNHTEIIFKQVINESKFFTSSNMMELSTFFLIYLLLFVVNPLVIYCETNCSSPWSSSHPSLLFSVIWLWFMEINASIVFCAEFWSCVSTLNLKRNLHFWTIPCFHVPNTNSTNIFSPLNHITCQHRVISTSDLHTLSLFPSGMSRF